MGDRRLPASEILAADPGTSPAGEVLARSRQGRPIVGHRLGDGPIRISLIGGCHADEPVGPEMLRRLVSWLASRTAGHALLRELTWFVVPHVNPDGAARNAAWAGGFVGATDHRGEKDRGYDLGAYLVGAVREPPGEDIEFGFPRGDDDTGVRPENRAVARFLRSGKPFHLHGSFHGMGFAPGPWFLIEASWIDRTAALRDSLRRRVREMSYRVYDVDRRGEKGFHRIDEGFTTRPDSRAMAAHFEALGDPGTAALFRPSSMEFVRSLGGDPFTLVSEMPLFLYDPERLPVSPTDTAGAVKLREWLARTATDPDPVSVTRRAAELGIRPMPLGDQMRLQIAFLEEALRVIDR